MTVNEAINYLEDAKIEFKIPKAAVTARKTNEALDMAIKALKQMNSSENQSNWIPCSERMPDEHEWLGTKKFGTTISDEV